MKRRNAVPLLIVLCMLVGSARAEEKRIVKPEDLVDLRDVSDVQVSPDGRRVAFVVAEPADAKKPLQPRDTNIWMVPSDGSEPARPFVVSPKADTHPRWSPDGRSLAFLSNRAQTVGEEKEVLNQLFLVRTDGGEAEQLTQLKGKVEDFEWSPDGRMLGFTVRDPKSDEEESRQKEGFDEIRVDRHYKYARLWIISLAERQPEQVTKQDLEVSAFAWSPDSSELVLRVSDTPRKDDVYWHARLVVVRRLTGEILRTLAHDAGDMRTRWSPDGRHVSYEQTDADGITSWLSVVPATGGTPRPLLKEYPCTPRDARWEFGSEYLVVECNQRTRDKFLRVHAASAAVTEFPFDTALPRFDFSLSQDGRVVAYEYGAGDMPNEVYASLEGGSPRRLSNLNPQARSWLLGAVKEITWNNKKDSQAVYGVLVTPPDFRPGKAYPTIVEVHGGPQWAWWSGWIGSWHDWAQLLASHGYVVFLPNPRGSTGQGVKFAAANREDWGGMDFQDIMSGVDYLIEQKIADAQRLGIGGWSYGGFMTSWAVTQTDRFKAAVVGAAVTNLFSFNGTTDVTPTFLRSYFLDIPFRRRSAYDNHSAMTFLANCKTPSLVLHGQADERVPVSQGWEFYNGLKMLGVPTEMVVYPREPHGFRERPHQIDLLSRILAWYGKYLKN